MHMCIHVEDKRPIFAIIALFALFQVSSIDANQDLLHIRRSQEALAFEPITYACFIC